MTAFKCLFSSIFVREWAQDILTNNVCDEKTWRIAEKTCREFFREPKLYECQRVISPNEFINFCTVGVCKNSSPDWKCFMASQFIQECRSRDIELKNWRTELFCPIECKDNFSFSENSPNCEKSCSGKMIGKCDQEELK
jgi:hypothetical protein